MCKRVKQKVSDVIVNKYTRHNITAWGTFTDYIFVLKDFGELEVGKYKYIDYSIGDTYVFEIKRRIK